MKLPTETQEHFDERIVDYIDRHRIDVNGIYKDLKEKREFLRDVVGYSRLMIGKGQFVPLSQCADERVSSTVKGIDSAARKRLQKKK